MKNKEIVKELLYLADNNPYGYHFSAMIAEGHKTIWGWNCVTELGDPTAHAEMEALRQAAIHGVDFTKATIFCSHEPCPMCLTAIAWSGIKKVFYVKTYDQADENNAFYDQPSKRVNGLLSLKLDIKQLKGVNK